MASDRGTERTCLAIILNKSISWTLRRRSSGGVLGVDTATSPVPPLRSLPVARRGSAGSSCSALRPFACVQNDHVHLPSTLHLPVPFRGDHPPQPLSTDTRILSSFHPHPQRARQSSGGCSRVQTTAKKDAGIGRARWLNQRY